MAQDWSAQNKAKRDLRRKKRGLPVDTKLPKGRLPHPDAPPVGSPDYMRWVRYRITADEYQRMLGEQSHACAICKTPFGDNKVCVDHCHDKNHVRGLLCNDCNIGLGRFKDDVQRVAAAVDYLSNGLDKKSPLA